MLKRVFKLSPDDYESLYSGTPVVKTGITLSLDDSTHVLTVTESGETVTLNSGDYIINIEDKYLTPEDTEDMFDDLDTVATPQEVADLFGTVTPESRQLIVDLIYPVGSIYTTINSALPSYLSETGTWVSFNNGNPVTIPLGSSAPVFAGATRHDIQTGNKMTFKLAASGTNYIPTSNEGLGVGTSGDMIKYTSISTASSSPIVPDSLYADLSQATAAFYMFKRIA